MEQFWLRDKEEGVIFLMNVDSDDEADRLLKALPLGQANLLTFDLMPIGPLLPLGMLMKAKMQHSAACGARPQRRIKPRCQPGCPRGPGRLETDSTLVSPSRSAAAIPRVLT